MTQTAYRPRQNRGYKNFNNNRQSRALGSRYNRRTPYKKDYLNEQLFIHKPVVSEEVSVYESGVTFADFNLASKLLLNIKIKNYVHPTKIQAQVITEAMHGKDILGMARTGSGKTAAYLIPIVHEILSGSKKRCLIVAPTRELVSQIQTELKSLAQNTVIRDVLIVGGSSYSAQISILRKNPQMVIATPGRLIDLSNNNQVDLGSFDCVVLDEVDQMLDMGFIHDVKLIISKLKSPRQSLFFSATLSSKSREIATSLLNNPTVVETEAQSPAKNVEQNIIRVNGSKSKIDVLHELLVNTDFQKVLVFSQTKRRADDISRALQIKGHKCDALHGNKSQRIRTKILGMFRRSEIDILIATDVASRGIDIPDITHVINYDQPATHEDYIHRIGRVGRIGKKGVALTFV